MKSSFLGGLSALVLAATLSAPAAAATHAIAPDHLSDYWQLVGSSWDAMVPNSGRNMSKPGCVAVTYTVGADGVTRNVRAARTVPASDLDKVAVSLVKHFRYQASDGNSANVPMRTYYVVPFNVKQLPKAQRDQVIARCSLPGYGA